MKHFRSKPDERGAVSFLSVLVFIIIIVTVTLAYMQSVTRQQRNALNYDLGNRAYYAAEAGVQDTVRALRGDIIPLTNGAKDYCLENGNQDAFGGTGVIGGHEQYGVRFTCQLVDTSQISSTLTPGRDSATMRIRPVSGSLPSTFDLNIQWGVPSEESTTPTTYYGRGGDYRYFPPTTNWNNGGVLDGTTGAQPVYPLLRAAVITHPSSNFNRGQIRQRVTFLNPRSSTGSNLANFNMSTGSISSGQQSTIVTQAVCSNQATAGNLSACGVTLRISGHEPEVYLNLSSLYRQATYTVTARSGGNPIPLANTMATIDVTARAGRDVFRRVRQTVSLGENYRVHSGSDSAALTVGEGICKAFSVNSSASGFSTACTP